MSLRKLLAYALMLVYVVIFSSGCSQGENNVPSDTIKKEENTPLVGEKSTIKSEETLTTVSQIDELSIKEAWGNIPIIQKVYFSKPRVHYSISETGDLLSGESSSRDEEPNTTLIINNIYNDTTEKIKTVRWPVQITSGTINSEWVVWKEIFGTNIVSDKCEIYAYNRKTKNIKLYFKTPVDKDGNSIGGHEPVPELKGDEFLIDVVSAPNLEGLSTITSRKYDLTTGKFQVIVEQFALPKWGNTGYIGMGEDKEIKGYSQLLKFENGILKPLISKGAYIYDYATDGEAVLYTGQRFKTDNAANEAQESNLWLCENENEILLKSPTVEGPDGCGWPSLSKRIAMWGFGAKPYAYDRVLKKIVSLNGDELGAAFYTNDKYLFWRSRSKQDGEYGQSMINIIEIYKLP